MPRSHVFAFLLVLGVLTAAHAARYQEGEPFFNNDETRHVMTGVFFRDLYADRPVAELRDYTVRYYMQYPALGLLVWPPLFYAVEGAFMLVFGDSLLAAKALVWLFGAGACWYLFLLARKTHDAGTATLAVLLFGLAPLVFRFSEHVMLEVPTMTFVLAALYHVNAYLDDPRRRHLILGCAATAAAALTRFDGVLLAPCFALLIAIRWRWDVLRRWQVWVGAALAVLVALPYYLLVARELSSVHAQTMQVGTGGEVESTFLAPYNFLFYVTCVPRQVGWFAVPAVVLGLALAFRPGWRTRSGPYLALAVANYLTFSPLAELESRHTIYLVPALAVFAADAVVVAGRWLSRLAARGKARTPPSPEAPAGVTAAGAVLGCVVVAGTAWMTFSSPSYHLRGFEQAAQYVVEHTTESPTCLFDSYLNGNFIYQIRRHDPARRLWVLRGDKLLYSSLGDPRVGYTEHARDEQGVLDLIYKYDPEYLVIEELDLPPDVRALVEPPMSGVLRKALRERTDRFELVEEFPLESNYVTFRDGKLLVYRNLVRNPNRASALEIEMLGLGRSLEAPLPGQAPR